MATEDASWRPVAVLAWSMPKPRDRHEVAAAMDLWEILGVIEECFQARPAHRAYILRGLGDWCATLAACGG